jgi:LacI family transcriptional regulator
MYSEARERGFQRTMGAFGLAPDPALQWQVRMTEEAGNSAAMDMMRRPILPTAMNCGSIFLAKGVCVALHELGLPAGRDGGDAGLVGACRS